MKITFEIDTHYDRACEVNKNDYRAAAAFLLHLVGDLDGADTIDEVPAGPKAPTEPNAATAPATASSVAPVAGIVPPPPSTAATAIVSNIPPPPPVPVNNDDGEDTPAAPSNVVNFPTLPAPPPPPSLVTTAAPLPSIVGPDLAKLAAAVTGAASAEVDKSGMPWDARIHQKSKNKKKDGNWKLIKGIDPTIVQAVTAELAVSRGAVAPVSLPPLVQPRTNSMSVPPVPPAIPAAASGVPAPPAPPAVPIPPVASAGAVGGINFRELIDKITAATRAGTITPQKVNEICMATGAPSLMQLNSMPDLIPDVNSRIDAFLAGLG